MFAVEETRNSEEVACCIRKHCLEMVHHAKSSHIGGALSCADIIAVLYADVANYDTAKPKWEGRDRIVLSKGHSGAAIYSALAECGFFSVNKLASYGDDGSDFSCHISHKQIPGIEITTGSLGHGVCVACGMALNGKLKGMKYRVFAIVGDGECDEGSVWEMAMLSAHYGLDNFTVIIDANGMQAMGKCKDIINLEPFAKKWDAFGWHVIETDGHDYACLRDAFYAESNGKPKVIIARTIKGKGVSFMENELLWHYRDPQGEFYEQALKELEMSRDA